MDNSKSFRKVGEKIISEGCIKKSCLMYTTTLAEALRKNGKKIILIYQAFLCSILLNLSNSCFAYSFNEIYKKVNKNEIYEIEYNHSKTAAIIKPDRGGSVLYVNFKTRQMKNILGDWINPGISWKSDDIALIRGSCGTGCAQSVMFIAPSTTISCPVHEFRFESLTSDMPPDFYNNNFLLLD